MPSPTSLSAYKQHKSTGQYDKQAAEVLRVITQAGINGLTNEEGAKLVSHKNFGPRRNGLWREGKVIITGDKRPTQRDGLADVVVARKFATSEQKEKNRLAVEAKIKEEEAAQRLFELEELVQFYEKHIKLAKREMRRALKRAVPPFKDLPPSPEKRALGSALKALRKIATEGQN